MYENVNMRQATTLFNSLLGEGATSVGDTNRDWLKSETK